MMRRLQILLLALLLSAALLAACAPAATPSPLSVSGLPTPFVASDVQAGLRLQPTAFPSLTPLGPAQNNLPYGSVQLNAQGVIVSTPIAGGSSPLLFSAQAIDPGTAPANVTPAATVVIVVAPTAVPAGDTIAVPPIGDTTGGFIVNGINTICIPVINFLLSITVGLVQAIWNAVGTQTNIVGQVALCVVVPLLLLWFYLFRRRRRRR
jgi:hypothetical protein